MSEPCRHPVAVRRISAREGAEFLSSHAPLANADMLRDAAPGAVGMTLLGQFADGGLVAVAGVRAVRNPLYDQVVWAECDSVRDLCCLLAAAPPGRLYLKVHDRAVAHWLEAGAGLRPEHRDVYCAVTEDRLVAQPGSEARILWASDARRFVEPHPPASASLAAGPSGPAVWGIERHGHIVCSRVCATVVHTAAARIGAIADLHTDQGWRCSGLASQLVSAMASALLTSNDYALYWTTPEKAASQHVAARVGFVQTDQVTEFLIEDAWRPRLSHSR